MVIDSPSTVVISQSRQFAGSPRFGAMTAYVDGKRVGVVFAQGTFSVEQFPYQSRRWSRIPAREELSIPVSPGEHVVRVRQWWYFSPGLRVEIEPVETVRLNADFNRTGGILRSLLRGTFTPWKALRVSLDG